MTRWRGWNGKPALCVAGPTTGPAPVVPRASSEPVGCPAAGSWRPDSVIATSRAGDPQLHTHVLVANLTRGPDGRWSALDAQAIYRSRRAAGAVYDAAVRHQLTARLGVDWLLTSRGDGEIAGIPQRVLKLFSKRRGEIEDELERLGQSGPVAANQATLVTRTGKNELDGETLDARWHAEAAAVGYGPDDIDSLLARPAHATDDDGRRWLWSRSGRVPASTAGDQPVAIRTTDPDTGQLVERVTTIDDFGAHVAAALVEKDSTFTRHQVTMAIAGLLRHTVSTRALERLTDVVIAQRHFVPLPHRPEQTGGWEHRWTSRHLLDVETSLLALLQPEPGRCGALEEAAVDGALAAPGFSMLGSDQADMVRRVTTQGLPVEVVVGRAGTGKTYAMAAVRRDLRRGGLPPRRSRPIRPRRPRARRRGRDAGVHDPPLPAPRRPRPHRPARRRRRRSRHGRHRRPAPDRRRCPHRRRQGDPRRRPPPAPRDRRRRRVRRRRRRRSRLQR